MYIELSTLFEGLQCNSGLGRGDFVACVEHVQEREVTSGLECVVLHAVDTNGSS